MSFGNKTQDGYVCHLFFAYSFSLSILLSQFSSEDHTGGFEESRPTFTVINRDKETPYTEKMMEFFKSSRNLGALER